MLTERYPADVGFEFGYSRNGGVLRRLVSHIGGRGCCDRIRERIWKERAVKLQFTGITFLMGRLPGAKVLQLTVIAL
jgi:hypothetical protein